VQNVPTVDALIVSFNTRDVLAETISSLLVHRPPSGVAELRISVFDNASRDGSAAMVARDFPDVRLVTSDTNVGFGAANNTLAGQSEADYLLLVNSDVVFTRDIVEPLLQRLQERPEVIVASPRLVYPDGRVQHSAQGLPSLTYELAELLRGRRLGRLLSRAFDADARVEAVRQHRLTEARVTPRHPDSLWATCWLMRREDVRIHGLFDPAFPMYDEDLDFCRRVHDRGRRLEYVPGAELVHLGGASSERRAKHRMMMRARRAYYRRHHGRLAAWGYAFGLPVIDALARWVERAPTRQVVTRR